MYVRTCVCIYVRVFVCTCVSECLLCFASMFVMVMNESFFPE
jgi:hypothetical protein